ncbi:hypothetical protein H9N28_03970 [Rhodobacter capsulatus]|uniref:hypothetical protein n=1 Tax=Rhodobacter capsulatus TaxID=1061 RepID=UPI0006DD2DE9|nr:hypothetical protein [Rhodobacter capsulatus]KQB13983.1 hypothetical protein AP073_16275 [Rhodobacter capsulatus]KQB14302.1 hypothetical protein AP071_15610 [Rhodobacter capsulatus]PZX25701.1 hypothetical protein LY44_01484 [Rhodobacter capsulatus]QNR64006.1 hypothetical protein H9N28_03970 [Rhodobacter capsulatus]
MVGASKILTVSYGTFSCTLEGFDEPFTTMKAIAEYFRDLAAEDRYFGAEPPQPDAEMLHRIAEREMARRVDAKIEKNSVVLRPGAAATPEPAPAVVAMPAVVQVAVTPVGPAAAAPEGVGDPISESVAAKLQRIRSAVAQARAAQGPADPEPDLPAPPQAAPAVTPDPAPETAAEPIAAPEDFGFALDISGPLRAEELSAEEPSAEATQPPRADPAAESEDEDEDETPGGSMDPEKIERMRRRAERRAARQLQAEAQGTAEDAVEDAAEPGTTPEAEAVPAPAAPVTASPEMASPETTAPEVAAAEAAASPEAPRPVIRARVIKLRRAEPLAAAAAVPAPEAEVPPEAAEDIDRMLASVSATMAEAAAPESPAAPEPAALSAEAEAELMADLAALTEDLGDVDWGIEGWSTESAEADPAPAETEPAATEAAPEPEVDLEALVVELDPEPEPEPEEDAPAAAAAPEAPAVRTPAIDLDALFAEDPPEPAPAALTVVQVPPDALPPGVTDRRTHPTEPLILPARPAAKAPPLPEGDLPRLLEKADAQMAGNENRRRISAIAHLKAAVAATVAERRAGNEAVEKDETAPYRQDLTQAVRPRRPVLPGVGESHHQTAARPEARPAPLVLVSEQRVDRAPAEAVAKAQAVRPRRIVAATLVQETAPEAADDEIELPLSPEEASSFAEFAQSRAPQGLAELLEAAAAYTAQVEGRPHFSPPQIMSKVSAVGDASFSREDRLRMFGTLLRQGKIAKVKRGQYAITEASRFYQARA